MDRTIVRNMRKILFFETLSCRVLHPKLAQELPVHIINLFSLYIYTYTYAPRRIKQVSVVTNCFVSKTALKPTMHFTD